MCECGEDHSSFHIYDRSEPADLSRRRFFRASAALTAGGAAMLGGAGQAGAQTPQGVPQAAPAPAAPRPFENRKGVIYWGRGDEAIDAQSVLDSRQGPSRTTGTKFQALVRHGTELTTETLTLLPIQPKQVVIRMQASQTCYSTVGQLMTGATAQFAAVAGHGGVGVIEDVGSAVQRVKVGDQVILSTSPNCGTCLNCLSGRGDVCYSRLPSIPNAVMADKTPVYMDAPVMGPAGYAEMIVSNEDWVVPVFTKVSPVELSILACVGGTGLGLAMCRFPVESGTEVAILGLGPIGISAVQGARIQGARTIIGVDPIARRRDLAMKLGATHVLDPNRLRGDALLDAIRDLTREEAPADRRHLGERAAGPLYVLEAVGGTRLPLPKGVEAPADLSGVEALQQAWSLARPGGYVRTCSIGHPAGATVSFPAAAWANAARTHVPGNYAGVQALRDLPRFVRLIERGQFDAKSLVGKVFGVDRMREALQMAADRTEITSVIQFS